MKNTFYRPEEINTNEFEEIISKLHDDFVYISQGHARENELKDYLVKLVEDQKQLERNAEMGFWGLADPATMPSDARVMYFYMPTYIATGILINAKLNYTNVIKQVAGFNQALKKGLLASTGRNFQGHGHDNLDGLIEALNVFITAKAHIFIELYPNDCLEFTNLLQGSLQHCEQLVLTNKTKGDWGEDYSIRLNCLLQASDSKKYLELTKQKRDEKIYLFVYGTLMSTNRNNMVYLADSSYIGKGTLNGYDLYDLESYPGIVQGNGKVKGELYAVSLDKLPEIDRYEGEGALYLRKLVQVCSEKNEKYSAFTYVYNKEIKGRIKTEYENQLWYEGIGKKLNENNLVWYACYGSNISKERFMKYIEGNKLSNREICRSGCSDKTPPREEKPYIFNNPIYFSNNSSTWDNKGVAFLDTNKKGKSYGKMYLITKEQFEEIKMQEGNSSNWYGRTLDLESIDGIPVKTITKAERTDDVMPSSRYLNIIKTGIHETYPEMSLLDIDAYLMKCYLNEGHINVLKFLRNQAHGVSIKYISNELWLEVRNVINIINDLRDAGLIKQDERNAGTGISWDDKEAIYYTVREKREVIDRLQIA